MLLVNVFSFYVISNLCIVDEYRSYSRMDDQRPGLGREKDRMGCEESITVLWVFDLVNTNHITPIM